jgi:inorganic pyrophosphatase
MKHPWRGARLPEGLLAGTALRAVPVVVETPAGSRNKYEVDGESGLLRLKRTLSSPVRYPANYGFVPRTLAPDGDPIDALVFTREPVAPLCMVDGRVVGGFVISDDRGREEEKLLLVEAGERSFAGVTEVGNLPMLDEVLEFFRCYKSLDGGKSVTVARVMPAEEAVEAIRRSHLAFSRDRKENGK